MKRPMQRARRALTDRGVEGLDDKLTCGKKDGWNSVCSRGRRGAGVVLDLTFGTPWVLLALPLLLLLPGRRHGLFWGARVLALALLVVALARPSIALPGEGIAVLVDVSQSLGARALEVLGELELEGAPLFYTFAGDVTAHPSAPTEAAAAAEPTPERTDIARALQVAGASGAGRLLLISDGAESAGDALAALPDRPVDVLPIAGPTNVRLEALLAPETARPGETVEVTAVVASDREGTVTLRPTQDGEALPPVTRTVSPGRTPLRFSVRVEDAEADQNPASSIGLEARLEVPFDQPLQDDLQRVDIAVAEDDPVLVLGDPAFADLLEVQGFDVRRGEPADVTAPLNYSAVVLRESAGAFTPGQLELLGSYVQGGGGLMMTGGPETFGLGGWYRTPVEAVLPVSTDLRTEVEVPLVALVIVMDTSQSMTAGSPSRLDLAKEGAIGVVDLAYERDTLGFITFSDRAEWIFRPRAATLQGKREMTAAILNVVPQGGTIFEPAYRDALAALEASEAAVKHIIVLTDGRFGDGGGPFSSSPGPDFSRLASVGRRGGITTSTIAIGDGADAGDLRRIADAGGGRFYEALDVSTLPRIFTTEALSATRSLLREGPLSPIPRDHPLTPAAALQDVPAVDAYIASSLKSEGEMMLEGIDGEPLLAVSRQGLGRSAALTTDLNAFAGAFGGWEGLPGVLGTLTRWLQVRPATYAATTAAEGSGLRVVVDAVREGEYIDGEQLLARYSGAEVALEQVAPGRYEAFLDTPPAGGTLLVVGGGEVVARAQVTAPSGEFDTAGGEALLREIARRTGGEVLAEAGRYAPEMPARATPIWPWPALAGVMVFLLELLWRRFGPQGRA